MKKFTTFSHYVDLDKPVFTETTIDVIMSDCIIDLIDSGIDEDAHFRGAWSDNGITASDIDDIINDKECITRILEGMREPLVEKLKDVAESFRREDKE